LVAARATAKAAASRRTPKSSLFKFGALVKFENGGELGYPANSNYEEVAGHSYRSGKNERVGVLGGSGAAVGSDVGSGMANGWHGLL
jgi:hypothetical protein